MNLTWRAGNVLGFLHFFLLNWPHDNTTRHLVPEQRQPKSNVIKLLSFQGKWMHVNNEVNKEASDESEPGPRGEHGPNLQAGLQNTLAPFPEAFTFLPPWNRPLPKPITHQMETDCALDRRLWTPEISNVDLGQFITIDPSGIKTPQQLNLTLGGPATRCQQIRTNGLHGDEDFTAQIYLTSYNSFFFSVNQLIPKLYLIYRQTQTGKQNGTVNKIRFVSHKDKCHF